MKHLAKSGERFIVRMRVPKDLREIVGRSELKKSLGTSSETEALKRYPAVVEELNARIERHRCDATTVAENPSPPIDLKQLYDRVYADTQLAELAMRERVFNCLCTNQEEEQLFDFHVPVPEEYRAYFDWVLAEGDVEPIAIFLSKVRGEYHIRALRKCYQIGDVEDLKARAKNFVDADSESDHQLHSAIKTLMEAEIAALEALDREAGSLDETVKTSVTNTSTFDLSRDDLDQGPPLSEAIERWVELNDWVPKTRRERQTTMRHFAEICGDRPIASYAKEDGKKAREIFRSIPPNAHKMNIFKGRKIEAIARKANSGSYKKPSGKNINDKLDIISSFFNWAVNEYDAVSYNPIQGLKLRIDRRPRDQREPFKIDELNQLFQSPVYAGCRSIKQWAKPGGQILRESHLFWVPLIALFSGMRLAEIVFLDVVDVDLVDGVLCFQIRDNETRRLKTRSSVRNIPVHQTLLNIGFSDFIAARRKNGARLFPEAEMGPEDNPISPESKRFNRLLKKASLMRDRTTFHSFRHTFEDGCRNSGIPLEVINALQGHAERGMSGRYGSGYSAKFLADHIQRLSYGGLDIEHLTVSKKR